MKEPQCNMPEPDAVVTESLNSIFVDCDGPEDTTVRPLRFKIPRPWPEDVPFPPPADDPTGTPMEPPPQK